MLGKTTDSRSPDHTVPRYSNSLDISFELSQVYSFTSSNHCLVRLAFIFTSRLKKSQQREFYRQFISVIASKAQSKSVNVGRNHSSNVFIYFRLHQSAQSGVRRSSENSWWQVCPGGGANACNTRWLPKVCVANSNTYPLFVHHRSGTSVYKTKKNKNASVKKFTMIS